MAQVEQSFGRDIRVLFDVGALGELADRDLLERLNVGDKESAELAFAVIVDRHGPMVLHACRSIVRDRHEAEDAFQATFLVLSRKARSLWVRDSLGRWLFGVACRVAWSARRSAARRRMHEQRAAESVTQTPHDSSGDDRDAVLYDELSRLPERYRIAVALCDLEGLTQEEAARRLGWPSGTVRSRLARGRGRLRDRLTRRGLAPAILPIGAALARPTVPAFRAAATVQNAVRTAAVGAGTGTMASVIALTEGTMSIMFLSKLKLIVGVVLTGGFLVSGTALIGHRVAGLPQAATAEAKTQPEKHVGSQPAGIAQAAANPEPLSSNAMARLALAKKLRDDALTLFQEGETTLPAYLAAQRRYDEVGEVTLKSDADRVRFNEDRVVALKRIEQLLRKKHARGEVSQRDVILVELDRLEAEDAVARAKARAGAVGDAVKARLEVAKKVRDAKFRNFKAGVDGAEEFLTWQKRYDDLAFDVMLMTGGNTRLFEDRVAELKLVEKLIEGLFQRGQVQETDLDIVRYYRLEAEERLASARVGNGEAPDHAANKRYSP